MLDRHHLAIVREIHRRGTLTEAAKALHLSQPALTHSIKKLEQQLGASLWTKDGRTLRFSAAGEQVLRLANRLLPQFEDAEINIAQIAKGQRGILRIGMECHPCYQWLLKIVAPYLKQWPDVDVDVKQAFQFGGIGALFGHEIDILVTPDPLAKTSLVFTPVFAYEQVLVVSREHPLADKLFATPQDILPEVLITYPVEIERLDIFNQFLLPAACQPKQHKIIETTEIMLQLVAAGRGVAALPRWLAEEFQEKLPITAVRLGKKGIAKQIYLGAREVELNTDFVAAFIKLASNKY
jgi:LysR family transcriptional regulator for metE and metH